MAKENHRELVKRVKECGRNRDYTSIVNTSAKSKHVELLLNPHFRALEPYLQCATWPTRKKREVGRAVYAVVKELRVGGQKWAGN